MTALPDAFPLALSAMICWMKARLSASPAIEDSGEITVTEADIQQDITDVPPGILAVLAQSGMCLAELDELIMQEEIIYGR